jgi:hypothetical protein
MAGSGLLWRLVGEFSADISAVSCWARQDGWASLPLLSDVERGAGGEERGGDRSGRSEGAEPVRAARAESRAGELQADEVVASVDLLRADALVKERLVQHEEQRKADWRSVKGERLRAAVDAAPEATYRRAMALRNLGLFVAEEEKRPWKCVDPLLEAWSILQQQEGSEAGLARESEFLEKAAPCLVSARKLEYAVAMASRRASILRIVDPAAANAASVWAQELRNRAEQGGNLHKRILSLKVEREVDALPPLLLQPRERQYQQQQQEQQQQPLRPEPPKAPTEPQQEGQQGQPQQGQPQPPQQQGQPQPP